MKKWMIGVLACLLLGLIIAGVVLLTGGEPLALGQLTYEDGKYNGYLRDGKPEGFGARSYTDGSSTMKAMYIGQYKAGEFSGQGFLLNYGDDEAEILLTAGIFKNGQLNGEGAILYKDGRRVAGTFKNGEIIAGKEQSSQNEYLMYASLYDSESLYMSEALASAPEIVHGYGVGITGDDPEVDHMADIDSFYVGTFEQGEMYNGILVMPEEDSYSIIQYKNGVPGKEKVQK
ncbi:MAG: hypothetical protein LBM74_04240 [Oscillospiraceae bacterium]|jgi:hypothetical protein|nr:hypothetical protein [Oscillospiraceae bacterium]